MTTVLGRELLAILRSPRAAAGLVAVALACVAVVLVRWPADGIADLSGATSRGVLALFAWGLLACVLLLAPAFAAPSIVRERLRGTLMLLFNSPIHPWAIYAGKFLAILAFVAIVLAASLPAAAGCLALGGVDPWRQVAMLYAVLFLVAAQCVAIGLLVSSRTGGTDAAIRVTFAAVFALVFVTLGPRFLTQGQPGPAALVADWLRRLSPLPPVLEITGTTAGGAPGLAERGSALPPFFAAGGLLLAGLVAATLARFDHRIFDRARDAGKITDDQSLAVRSARRLFYLVDPQRRSAGIPSWLNPVLVKEFRTRKFGRLHWLLRLAAGCAVVSLLLTLAATSGTVAWGVETIGGLLVLLQVALVVVITPSLASGLVAAEREWGGWNLLRMTTLSGVRIALGKLGSVLWTVLLVLAATLPGYLMMITIKPTMASQVTLALVSVLLAVAMSIAVSAAVGSFFSSTTAATVTVSLVLLVIYLVPMGIWAFRDDPFGHAFVETALKATPLAAALAAIRMPGFTGYDLTPGAWWVAGTVTLAGLAVFALRIRRLLQPE
ncbi:MAG: ABC transporter permease [Planctomycetota bacterium]